MHVWWGTCNKQHPSPLLEAGVVGEASHGMFSVVKNQRQQLKGKIVSALFHTFWHFATHFHTFSEFFRTVPPGLFLRVKGFYYCFCSKRRKDNIKENKKRKTKPFCTLVVAHLSSSETIREEQTRVFLNHAFA